MTRPSQQEIERKAEKNRAAWGDAYSPKQLEPLLPVGAKVSKYRSVKTIIDGETFHSAKEARRYQDLKLMQAARQITGLRRQVPHPVYINGLHICDWFADFVYRRTDNDCKVTEDTKGYKTDVYKLKKKMVEAYYGFRILET